MSNAAYTYRPHAPSDILLIKDLMRVRGEACDDIASYHHAPLDDTCHARLMAKPHYIAMVA